MTSRREKTLQSYCSVDFDFLLDAKNRNSLLKTTPTLASSRRSVSWVKREKIKKALPRCALIN